MRERIVRLASLTVVLTSALTLASCASITPGESPSVQFTVPLTLEQTYERALAQTRYCLVTEDDFPVEASVAADKRQAQVKVLLDFRTSVVAQVDMESLAPQSTRVDIQMWGKNIWDQSAIDAMQAAIEFGVPSCTNYFPGSETKNQTIIKQRR